MREETLFTVSKDIIPLKMGHLSYIFLCWVTKSRRDKERDATMDGIGSGKGDERMKPTRIVVWGVGAMGAGIARVIHKRIQGDARNGCPPGFFYKL